MTKFAFYSNFSAMKFNYALCHKIEFTAKRYTDYHVFVIGEETEAKQVAELFKETHNAVHLIQGGYASLLEMDGMGKYITTEKFELTHVRSDDRDMIKSKE